MNKVDIKPLVIAGKSFSSRLLVGTGKYGSLEKMSEALASTSCEIVTVSLRRIDFDSQEPDILSAIDSERYLILPNTSGARDAEEAVRLARLARNASGNKWVKLEVTPEPRYLMPDPIETLKAAEILVKEGFIVLPYIHADPILAKRLIEVGTATVMPLAAPIGSNKGVTTKESILIIIEQSTVPVVVDAGLGLPSHACHAMELGADAVLINTAIAAAADPVVMGEAFRQAVEAGRAAFLSGPDAVRDGESSSPLTGFLR